MSIEEMIRAWKSDEDVSALAAPRNPIGEELTDEDLLEIVGGVRCVMPCSSTNACGGSLCSDDTGSWV